MECWMLAIRCKGGVVPIGVYQTREEAEGVSFETQGTPDFLQSVFYDADLSDPLSVLLVHFKGGRPGSVRAIKHFRRTTR